MSKRRLEIKHGRHRKTAVTVKPPDDRRDLPPLARLELDGVKTHIIDAAYRAFPEVISVELRAHRAPDVVRLDIIVRTLRTGDPSIHRIEELVVQAIEQYRPYDVHISVRVKEVPL